MFCDKKRNTTQNIKKYRKFNFFRATVDYFQFSCQYDKVLTDLLRKHVDNMQTKLR